MQLSISSIIDHNNDEFAIRLLILMIDSSTANLCTYEQPMHTHTLPKWTTTAHTHIFPEWTANGHTHLSRMNSQSTHKHVPCLSWCVLRLTAHFKTHYTDYPHTHLEIMKSQYTHIHCQNSDVFSGWLHIPKHTEQPIHIQCLNLRLTAHLKTL